jgi:hypothetical protein
MSRATTLASLLRQALCELVERLHAKGEALPESLCDAKSLREILCALVARLYAKGETLPESPCDAKSLREALCELPERLRAKGEALSVFVALHTTRKRTGSDQSPVPPSSNGESGRGTR